MRDGETMRRAAKVDRNHAEIVAAFRMFGCTVQSLAAVGAGVPDLLVGWRMKNFLVEVKDGTKTKSQRKLTPAQIAFHSTWLGQIFIVECAEDVRKIMDVKTIFSVV